jgi:hypothetical protein
MPPAVTSEDVVNDFLIREFVPYEPADVDSVLSNGNCFKCPNVKTHAVVDSTPNRNHVAHGGSGFLVAHEWIHVVEQIGVD